MDPLLIAIIGGIVGGAATGGVWTLVGYLMSERSTKDRKQRDEALTRAKESAGELFWLLCELLMVQSVPKAIEEVTDAVSQLRFAVWPQGLPFSPAELFKVIVFLPSKERDSIMFALNKAHELEASVKRAKARAEALTGQGPSWLDGFRPWTNADNGDPEFHGLFAKVVQMRSEALDAVTEAMQRIDKLVGPVIDGFPDRSPKA